MAPEQAEGEKIGPAADIYSLGAILYHLLVGKPPFQAPTPFELLVKLKQEEPIPPQKMDRRIDRELSIICLKCLDKDPRRRYGSAAALSDDLQRWHDKRPILARRAGMGLRTYRWAQRNHAASVFLASLLAGLALSLLVLKRAKDEQEEKNLALTILKRSISGYIYQVGKPPPSMVDISSEQLRILSGRALPRQSGVGLTRLKGGVFIAENPMATVLGYAEMFSLLEEAVSRKLGQNVRIDLRLYLDSSQARKDLVAGRVDFGRLSPALYLSCRQEGNIAILAKDHPGDYSAVIFARSDSGITNLAGLNGHSLAFWDRDSMPTIAAKAILYKSGLCHDHFPREQYLSEAETEPGPGLYIEAPERSYFDKQGRTVISVLKEQKHEAGVAMSRQFRLYSPDDWRPLATFQPGGSVWAGSAALRAEFARTLKAALLELPRPNASGEPDFANGYEVPLCQGDDGELEAWRGSFRDAQSFDQCNDRKQPQSDSN
jgi:hypothetical protein